MNLLTTCMHKLTRIINHHRILTGNPDCIFHDVKRYNLMCQWTVDTENVGMENEHANTEFTAFYRTESGLASCHIDL